MGRPRSVFNRDLDTERTKGKQYAQNRQNITGMSSTFRGMPLNAPQVSGGQTNRVGQDTLKIKTMYLDSLRVDGITRVDLATVSGGAGITSTVASGQYHDFKVGSTSLLNIGPTNVTFKNTILAPAIDLGTISSRIGGIYCDSIDVDNDLKASGDIILGDSTAGDTIDITALFISPLYINGQNMFFDTDQDSKIYSGSDDSIKIVTGGNLQLEANNSGVGIVNDVLMQSDLAVSGGLIVTGEIATNSNLVVFGNTTLGNASSDNISMNGTLATDIEMGGNDLDFGTGGTIDFHNIVTSGITGGSASALPSNPTAYFTVKWQGNTRYIPYYS